MSVRKFFISVCLLLSMVQGAWAASDNGVSMVRPFDTTSLAQIRQAHAGRPFVLVLWSQTCHFCMQHLGQWAALQKQAPKVAIILVNTDPLAEQAAIPQLVRQFKLTSLAHYVFADDNHAPLRWSIDPQWHGELPRHYFFDKAHQPTATSGVLDKAQLVAWLKQMGR